MTFIEYILGWNLAAIICLVVGLVLVGIEIFTPGLGAPGILGAVALVATVILRADSLAAALITLVLVLLVLGVAAFFVLRSFKQGHLRRTPFVLKEAIDGTSTPLSNEDMQQLVGCEGVCLNTLRPSGNAEINGRRVDVVSVGDYIQKGAKVQVVGVEGLRVLVKEV